MCSSPSYREATSTMDPIFDDPIFQQMFGFDTKLSREELLSVLSNFGISIPPASKLPKESLQKRLRQAINASQAISLVNPKPPLDLQQYSKWPQGYKGVFDAIRRGNLEEAAMTQLAMRQGQDPARLYVNAFMDVRQTLMSLANNCETGYKHAVMQDLDQDKCAINLRVRLFATMEAVVSTDTSSVVVRLSMSTKLMNIRRCYLSSTTLSIKLTHCLAFDGYRSSCRSIRKCPTSAQLNSNRNCCSSFWR